MRKLRERLPAVAEQLLYGVRRNKICDPPIGEGLHYQVAEVNNCLRAGRRESEIMPLKESKHYSVKGPNSTTKRI